MNATHEAARDWWRGSVIYQVYPRSFADSNADGIGDLPGITARLPSTAELGVDAVWLAPFFKSPMKDFGYDVADHEDVDPMFGTLDDFVALTARAHELGLKVIIDQVLSAMVAQYTEGGDKLHQGYCFDLLSADHSAGHIRGVIERFESMPGDGWPCWALSNHDCMRWATRWGGAHPPTALLRLGAALALSLRGSVCLYQGEELGLPEAELAFEELRDPYGLAMWPEYKGRDGCRTPMPWDSTAPDLGFGSGNVRPWLPIVEAHRALAFDRQEADPGSLLHHVRRLLRWRRTRAVLIHGTIELLPAHPQVLAFVRACAGERVLCAFNLDDQAATLALRGADQPMKVLDESGATGARVRAGAIDFDPFGVLFASLS